LATNIDSTPSFESLAARLGSEANHDADMMDTASVKVAASPASARKTRLSIGGLLNSASPAARRASLSALMAAADAAAAKLSMSTSALSVTSGSAALAGLSSLSSRDQHLLLSELQIDVEADLEGLDLACASCTDLRTELGRVQDECSAAHAELTANQNELALCVAELNAVREALAAKEIALGASEAELINFREDTNAYNEKCLQIQDEGRMLYEQYEVKCVRVKELNKKIGALKEMCQTLEEENNTLRSKCEEYAAAYEQENSRIIELTTDLEAARSEAASATMKAKHAKQATTNIDQRRRSKMPLNEDDENDSSAAELALRAEVEHWQQAHAQAQDGAAELRRVCDEWTAKANALQVEVASLKQATQHSYQTPRTPKSMSASSTPLRTPTTPVVQKQLTNQLNALQAQHESVLEELYTEREKCAQLDYQCAQLEAAAGGIQLQLHIYAPSDAAEVEAEANKAIEAAQQSASESIAALQHKLEQTQAELVTARTQQANAARAAQAIVASGSSNGGEIESLMISNELLRDEVAALQEAKQQNVMLQARAQAADGYALMINKLRAELAEYVFWFMCCIYE
jgi:predicted  nucleic acid-binding Zn-ribbon protein